MAWQRSPLRTYARNGVSEAANPIFLIRRVPDIKFDIEQFRNCEALRNLNMELPNLIETMRPGKRGRAAFLKKGAAH